MTSQFTAARSKLPARSTSKVPKMDCLRVGTARNSKTGKVKIFVGFPDAVYDKATLPLSGTHTHVLILDRDDMEWVVRAVTKELKRASSKP